MKKLFLFFLIFSLPTAFAEIISDIVYKVDPGHGAQEGLLYLENGRVLFVDPEIPINDISPGVEIAAEVDEANRLRAYHLGLKKVSFEKNFPEEAPSEQATVLPHLESLAAIFSGMNRAYYKNTECTDRAHVWSYEEWKKHSLVSRKVFMFFTSTYIRRYNYQWWFHVSPYALVKDNEKVTEYVIDRRFSSKPQRMKEWSDAFIHSKKECPVSTYAHYRANNYGQEHCYLVKSHMYNRLPLHVENEEIRGQSRTGFSSSEVNYAYRAFYQRGF